MTFYVLPLYAGPEGHRFGLMDEEGETVRTGPCAKELGAYAFNDLKARIVSYPFDLNLDDCPGHTLARVRG